MVRLVDAETREIGQKAFRSFLDTFITPEVIRRQSLGLLPCPLDLQAGQLLCFADGRPNEVRINDEVRALALVQVTRSVNQGDPVRVGDFDEVHEVALSERDDPNCGHATFFRVGDRFMFSFDFTYNRKRAQVGLEKAREFLSTATLALSEGHLVAFAENLFAAVELAARSELLLAPNPKFLEKANHGTIHAALNRQRKLGKVPDTFVEAFNELTAIRYAMRYSHEPGGLSSERATQLLEQVADGIDSLRVATVRSNGIPSPDP